MTTPAQSLRRSPAGLAPMAEDDPAREEARLEAALWAAWVKQQAQQQFNQERGFSDLYTPEQQAAIRAEVAKISLSPNEMANRGFRLSSDKSPEEFANAIAAAKLGPGATMSHRGGPLQNYYVEPPMGPGPELRSYDDEIEVRRRLGMAAPARDREEYDAMLVWALGPDAEHGTTDDRSGRQPLDGPSTYNARLQRNVRADEVMLAREKSRKTRKQAALDATRDQRLANALGRGGRGGVGMGGEGNDLMTLAAQVLNSGVQGDEFRTLMTAIIGQQELGQRAADNAADRKAKNKESKRNARTTLEVAGLENAPKNRELDLVESEAAKVPPTASDAEKAFWNDPVVTDPNSSYSDKLISARRAGLLNLPPGADEVFKAMQEEEAKNPGFLRRLLMPPRLRQPVVFNEPSNERAPPPRSKLRQGKPFPDITFLQDLFDE